MTPYYADDLVTIYHGDCREWMPEADVLVTDPPYGMGYQSNFALTGPSRPIAGDGDTTLRDWLLSVWTGPALVFGTWRVPRPPCDQLLVWDKGDTPGMGNLTIPWGPSHEEVYVIGSGFSGRRSGSVLRVRGYGAMADARPDHPTPKPVALMAQLIEKCPSGTILDPFMGSGTTLVAAKSLGRKAIGIEIEERYCEIAATRCSQEVLGLAG
jgi:DNA modification methylase